MPESFGARLRQRREERGIELTSIAEQTKIKFALLDALERDDVSQWPSGIFRRAYVRTYAHCIGLDPDGVLREFLETYPEPGDFFSALGADADASDETSRKNTAPPTRLRTMVDSAIGSLARLRRPASSASQPLAAGAPALSATASVTAHSAATMTRTDACEDSAIQSPPEPHLLDPPDHQIAESHTIEIPPLCVSDVAADDPCRVDISGAERSDEVRSYVTVRDPEASNTFTLEAIAHLCTEFGRAVDREDVQQLLRDAAQTVDATGLILWLWDDMAGELRPVLAQGYSEKLLAHLPSVGRDADNATAAAFRTASACQVAPTDHASGALVVPLLIPEGCAGVLAIELRQGIEATRTVRAIATVLAAALAQVVCRSRAADRRPPAEPPAPVVAKLRPAPRPAKVRRPLSDAV